MVNSCCVDGCLINDTISKDVILFKFPTSRLWRTKWLDAIKLSAKDAVNASVCSKHFLSTDYEHVRGRTRLKSHVVPTVFDENSSIRELKSDVPIAEECQDAIEDDVNTISDKSQMETDDKEDRIQENEDCSDRVENTEEISKEDEVEQNGEKLDKVQEELRDKSPDKDENIGKDDEVEDTDTIPKELGEKSPDTDSNIGTNDKVEDVDTVPNELREKSPDTGSNIGKNNKIDNADKIPKETRKKSTDIDSNIGKNDKVEENRKDKETPKESGESSDIEIKETGKEVSETIEICDIEKSIISHFVINDLDDSSNESCKIEDRNKGDEKKRKRGGKSNKDLDSVNNSGASVPAPNKPPDIDKDADIEELLTNYHIKQNNIHSLDNFEANRNELGTIDIEEDLPPLMTGSDPVFIEVAVDQDAAQGGDGRDCLMVLESVQVEVDPSALMLEQDFEIASDDLDDEPITIEDPAISLLTSSDEDEVIIQEPHIDTVEVSDETDEDDMPLVKLVKEAKKVKKKRPKVKNGDVLMWGLYEYYCVECQFRSTDQSEYNKHRLEHNKVLLMCQLCSYMTSSEIQLAKHEKQHKDFKRYQCHLCDYKAKHNMSLVYHLKSHNVKKFKCKKCKFSSTSESEQLRHLMVCRRKEKIKNKNIRCDKCSYRTDRPSDMRRHKKVHKDSDDEDDEYVP